MESLFKPYDKEYMRMAMLKHEQTFKEQVYELHRLYRIQKILMKSIENNMHNDHGNGTGLDHHHGSVMKQKSTRMNFDLERPADDYIAESNGDESEIELTLGLGLGPSSRNQSKKAETTTPINSDCGPSSFSSSSTGSSHIINRTLRDDQSGGCELEGDQLRQEKLKHPPWLLQVLGLNMTS